MRDAFDALRVDALRDAVDALRDALRDVVDAFDAFRDAFDSFLDALRDVYVDGVSRIVGNIMSNSSNFVTKMSWK